jgi:hypothetical protein
MSTQLPLPAIAPGTPYIPSAGVGCDGRMHRVLPPWLGVLAPVETMAVSRAACAMPNDVAVASLPRPQPPLSSLCRPTLRRWLDARGPARRAIASPDAQPRADLNLRPWSAHSINRYSVLRITRGASFLEKFWYRLCIHHLEGRTGPPRWKPWPGEAPMPPGQRRDGVHTVGWCGI